jgi:hypothetical protein
MCGIVLEADIYLPQFGSQATKENIFQLTTNMRFITTAREITTPTGRLIFLSKEKPLENWIIF